MNLYKYTDAELAEIYDKAADHLEVPRNWSPGKHVYGDQDGKFCCVLGVLGYVTRRRPGIPAPEVRRPLLRELGYPSSLVTWNDRQRDKRVVIRTLRRVARKLRGGVR